MFDEEIERIKGFGMSFEVMPQLIDVDTIADLKALAMVNKV